VHDYRRLAKDLAGGEDQLLTATRIALGLDEAPETAATQRIAEMSAHAGVDVTAG
jgi:hypothetical protein